MAVQLTDKVYTTEDFAYFAREVLDVVVYQKDALPSLKQEVVEAVAKDALFHCRTLKIRSLCENIKAPPPLQKQHKIKRKFDVLTKNLNLYKDYVHSSGCSTNSLQQALHQVKATSVIIQKFYTIRLAALSAPRTISQFIGYHNIHFEHHRFYIANNIADIAPDEVGPYISYYKLSEEFRFLLAKKLAKKGAQYLLPYLELFELNQEHSFAIAKTLARQNFQSISDHIERFGLSEEQRFLIAQRAISTDAYEACDILANCLDNYRLSAKYRYQLALHAAKKAPATLSANLDSFHLTEEEERFQVAKQGAEASGSTLSLFIHLYHLTEEHAFEIAKIAATQDGKDTVMQLANFALSSEHQEEIINLALQ